MKFFRSGVILMAFALIAFGCASSRSGDVYSRDSARQAHTVQWGTVEAVKNVKIEGTKSYVGPLAGAAAGGAVGSGIGHGAGKTIAVVGGAILGGVAGAATEEAITKKDGLEITVKLDDGKSISVVQEADVYVAIGERVRVLTGPDGTTRVSK